MVAFIGLGLALPSWLALLAILIVTVGLLAYLVRIEEEFLATELGDIYINYMKRTKRFPPFVW